jgi:hypothetical protein
MERFHRPSAAFFSFPGREGECVPRNYAPNSWRNQSENPKAIGYWYFTSNGIIYFSRSAIFRDNSGVCDVKIQESDSNFKFDQQSKWLAQRFKTLK